MPARRGAKPQGSARGCPQPRSNPRGSGRPCRQTPIEPTRLRVCLPAGAYGPQRSRAGLPAASDSTPTVRPCLRADHQPASRARSRLPADPRPCRRPTHQTAVAARASNHASTSAPSRVVRLATATSLGRSHTLELVLVSRTLFPRHRLNPPGLPNHAISLAQSVARLPCWPSLPTPRPRRVHNSWVRHPASTKREHAPFESRRRRQPRPRRLPRARSSPIPEPRSGARAARRIQSHPAPKFRRQHGTPHRSAVHPSLRRPPRSTLGSSRRADSCASPAPPVSRESPARTDARHRPRGGTRIALSMRNLAHRMPQEPPKPQPSPPTASTHATGLMGTGLGMASRSRRQDRLELARPFAPSDPRRRSGRSERNGSNPETRGAVAQSQRPGSRSELTAPTFPKLHRPGRESRPASRRGTERSTPTPISRQREHRAEPSVWPRGALLRAPPPLGAQLDLSLAAPSTRGSRQSPPGSRDASRHSGSFRNGLGRTVRRARREQPELHPAGASETRLSRT